MTLEPSRVLDLDRLHRFAMWMLDGREEAHARAQAIVRARVKTTDLAQPACTISNRPNCDTCAA